jgi:predicted membrane protein (TIGR00267 family)
MSILEDVVEFFADGGDAMSRRYFVSNGFDGTLTSIGVAVGAVLSGVPTGWLVIKIGLGAAVGLGTSGIWSVWEIERAERRIERLDIEDAMLEDLEGTRVEAQRVERRRINAVMSGLGPILGVMIPMSAYLLEPLPAVGMIQATLLAVALGVALLFVFGAYLGSLSKQRWYYAGARMGLAGLVVAAINVFLPG